MKKNRGNIFWGLALLLVGAVLTAVNFNLLPFEEPNLISGLFILSGLLFFLGYLTSGLTEWGWLFPASILSGVGGGIWLEELTNTGEFTGALIVFSVAIPFWAAFFTKRSNWWAIIPGGILTSVAAMIAGIGFGTLPDEVYVGGMLGGMGLVFLIVYWTRPKNWWAIIPGGILISVGAMIAGIGLTTMPDEVWVGAMLGGMGLVFLLIYWIRPKDWWAIIPGGSLLAVASTVTLAGLNLNDFWETRLIAGSLFFILALTFGALWLKRDAHKTVWAKYPAIVLGSIGAFVLLTGEDPELMFSLLMIGAGIWVLWKGRGKKDAIVDVDEGS